VSVDGRPGGVLTFADRCRPDARATVLQLSELTGTGPVLLTGDNPGAAAVLAADVRIDTLHAGLLPAQKVDRIRYLSHTRPPAPGHPLR
jgi:cation transport ATPase